MDFYTTYKRIVGSTSEISSQLLLWYNVCNRKPIKLTFPVHDIGSTLRFGQICYEADLSLSFSLCVCFICEWHYILTQTDNLGTNQGKGVFTVTGVVSNRLFVSMSVRLIVSVYDTICVFPSQCFIVCVSVCVCVCFTSRK